MGEIRQKSVAIFLLLLYHSLPYSASTYVGVVDAEKLKAKFAKYPLLNEDNYIFEAAEGGAHRATRGTHSRVRYATQPAKGNRRVAIKVVHPDFVRAGESIRSGLNQGVNEIKIMKLARHVKGVPRFYGVYRTEDNHLAIIMSHIGTTTMFQMCKKNRYAPLKPKGIRRTVRQLFEILAALHKIHICHRGVVPVHVTFDDNLNVGLVDLGIAELLEESEGRTSKSCMGVTCVMPPEVLQNHNSSIAHTCKIDVWSAGMMMWMLLSGTCAVPFTDKEPLWSSYNFQKKKSFVLGCVRTKKLEMPSPAFTDEARNLITRMMECDEAQRPTMAEVLEDVYFKEDRSKPHAPESTDGNIQNGHPQSTGVGDRMHGGPPSLSASEKEGGKHVKLTSDTRKHLDTNDEGQMGIEGNLNRKSSLLEMKGRGKESADQAESRDHLINDNHPSAGLETNEAANRSPVLERQFSHRRKPSAAKSHHTTKNEPLVVPDGQEQRNSHSKGSPPLSMGKNHELRRAPSSSSRSKSSTRQENHHAHRPSDSQSGLLPKIGGGKPAQLNAEIGSDSPSGQGGENENHNSYRKEEAEDEDFLGKAKKFLFGGKTSKEAERIAKEQFDALDEDNDGE